MPYVLRDTDGNIQAMSLTEGQGSDWHFIEASAGEYLDFLHASMSDQAKFRESDLHLARVLEDLISLADRARPDTLYRLSRSSTEAAYRTTILAQ